jgi:F0F1-type ATP synthase membrane subunit c/vacuolar-type H+-ATPase subunit K
MTGEPARDVLVEGTWNARIFGGERPWLLRSAALDGLTHHGRAALERWGIRQVIDLREPGEAGLPGHSLPVRRIPVFGRSGEPDRRATMESAYYTLMDYHGAALAAAVGAVASGAGAVAVHCAIGKDRTGLVVALALLAAGYSRDVVVADYAMSGARQPSFVRRRTEEQMAWDGIEAQTPAGREYLRRNLQSPPEVLAGVLDLLDLAGGAEAYLRSHGLTGEHFEALRSKARLDAVHAAEDRVPAFA